MESTRWMNFKQNLGHVRLTQASYVFPYSFFEKLGCTVYDHPLKVIVPVLIIIGILTDNVFEPALPS